MRAVATTFAAAALAATLAVPAASQQSDAGDRIYGRVVTASGEVFEGFIRWDRNEGSWADFLHGSKPLPEENFRDADRLGGEEEPDREDSVEFLGIRISWDDDRRARPNSATAGIRFGHLRSLEVLGDDEALLVLKSGEEVILESHSTDVGPGIREIVIEDSDRGRIELEWGDLELVDFMPAPSRAASSDGARLWGTVRTRYDMEFTGYVTWDLDEILAEDILDGEDRDRDREIPFRNVVSIERRSSGSARIVLANGEEVVLDDSNDVDDSNRGILVVDPHLGEVQVEWDEFQDVVFNPTGEPAGYDAYDGGARLYGTVEDEDGRQFTGYIRWDNDEEYNWEILDGAYRDIDFDVEFAHIRSIKKDGLRGSVVTLRDGRALELEEGNDVDRGNKGIFVVNGADDVTMVPWRDFRRVTFRTP